jgi:SAM-dependent methyltransferase
MSLRTDGPASCPCCQAALAEGAADWHFVCPSCGYECSILQAAVNAKETYGDLDETSREAGLYPLRRSNFRTILALIQALRPNARDESLLDVGAAHGWFVELAKPAFQRVAGIEPDEHIAQLARRRGVDLSTGFFPQVLDKEARFHVIVFNDVFEHIPDPTNTLAAVREHLAEDGIVVLNLPTAEGFFYRLAQLLLTLGLKGPFERMWQKGLPSPHLHYFSGANLGMLAADCGFAPVAGLSLPAIRLQGLHSRIALSRQHGRLVSRLIWLGILAASPLLPLLPKDTRVFVYAKRAKAPAE